MTEKETAREWLVQTLSSKSWGSYDMQAEAILAPDSPIAALVKAAQDVAQLSVCPFDYQQHISNDDADAMRDRLRAALAPFEEHKHG